jgi:phytoene desaturase
MLMKTDAVGQRAATMAPKVFVAQVMVLSGGFERVLAGGLHRKSWSNAKVASGKYSMSLFVWYVGSNKRFEEAQHHMMLLGPRYESLHTVRPDVAAVKRWV